MATYKVTVTHEGNTTTYDCPDDEYILDAAEESDLDLPYSCRAGSCSTCVATLESGSVNQDDQTFVTDAEKVSLLDTYVFTCVAYPTSDITITAGTETAFQAAEEAI